MSATAGFNTSPTWVKFTKTYADFSAASTTGTVTLKTLPYKAVLHAAVLQHTESFTGGSISAYTIKVGVSGTTNKYVAATDVYASAANTTFAPASSTTPFSPTMINSDTDVAIIATATSTGANTSAATAGSVDIWLLVSILP